MSSNLVTNVFNRTITHYKHLGEDSWGEDSFSNGVLVEDVLIENQTTEVKVNDNDVSLVTLIKVYTLKDEGIKVNDIIEPSVSFGRFKVLSQELVEFKSLAFAPINSYYQATAIRV